MSDWLNGFSCGSNGEYLVEEYLKKLKVSFKKQYSFDGCLSEKNHKLFFDFYLNELNICIEYDGKQHFEPVEFFGGKKIFNEIKNRDQLKNKFCEDNGIFLLRIPYNKNNDEIEKIIINVINNGKSF
jgi:very-short-patch-repair endonuclease